MTRSDRTGATGEATVLGRSLPTTAVVVAGGHSTRFGDADKLTATVDGRPMLERVLVTVAAVTERRPVVATRDEAHERRLRDAIDAVPEPRFVHDHGAYEGPVAGIASALEAVETPWVFACAGDMPWLSPFAIDALRERAVVRDADAVVPTREGRPEPLHGLYRRRAVADAITDCCPSTGVRGLVERVSPLVRVPTTHADAPFADSVRDVDTQAELPDDRHSPDLQP